MNNEIADKSILGKLRSLSKNRNDVIRGVYNLEKFIYTHQFVQSQKTMNTPDIKQEASQVGAIKKKKTNRKPLHVMDKVKHDLQEDFLPITSDGFDQANNQKDLCMFHLGNERYVVVNEFNGKMLIHIRQYDMDAKRTVRYPTKRGITLNVEKFKKLEELCVRDINECIKEVQEGKHVNYRYHLGGNVFVTVQSEWPSVNIRKWFLPPGESKELPTKKGIALTFEQWSFIKGAINLVKGLLKEQWDSTVFCEFSEDHQNQLGFLRCSNPNEYMNY